MTSNTLLGTLYERQRLWEASRRNFNVLEGSSMHENVKKRGVVQYETLVDTEPYATEPYGSNNV
jgi:hypothetical protein